MHRHPTIGLVLAAALGFAAGPASADIDYAEAEKLRADGSVLPTAKIVEIATTAQPGTVADVELERVLGRHVYEVEIRDASGREWTLDVDAKSGEILQTGRDD